ncbi:efflux RND transporter periplasmic adaptor subunit [Patescibacteria group bacterium]|nr:efflux RND transporter periplasmic adaptor subunit [Patescibacteria group bacterium]
MAKKLKALMRKRSSQIAAAVILIIALFYGYKAAKSKAPSVSYITAAVQKGTITSSVTGTGQVAASDQVDIKADSAGNVIAIRAVQGQTLKAGQIIAVLDQRNAAAQLAQAKASLLQAQASYDQLVAGTASTDLELANLSVQSAQSALDQAKQKYSTDVTQQQQAVAKALSNYLNADLTPIASDSNSSATVTISGNYSGTTQGKYTISVSQCLSGLCYSSSGLGSQDGILIRGTPLPLGQGLYATFSSSGSISTTTTWTINLPNPQSSNYINNQYTYQTALQTQTQTLSTDQNSITQAQNSLSQAQISLQQKQTPATNSDLAAAQAQVQSAQAALINAQNAYDSTIVKSPFDGILANLDVQVGDSTTSGEVVATVITNQTVANITLNEVDVSKIKVGDLVNLTFPAISDLNLTGKVAQIDTIGTVTQNVVNFNVKILLDTQNSQVKPGMSVSADIITAVDQDVLMVPSSAVKSGANGGSYVQTLVNGQPQQINVQVGISNDTDTEISGNIKEGDQVITQTVNSGSSSASPASSSSRPSGGLIPGLGGGGSNAIFRAARGGG